MPRGRTLRTKIREAAKGATPYLLAEKVAEQQFQDKRSFQSRAFEVLEKWIKDIDPLESAAILGATIIIKSGIDWTEDVLQATIEYRDTFPFLSFGWIFGYLAPELLGTDEYKKVMSSPSAELTEWMLSFTMAFVIIRNFGEIVAAGASLLSYAKLLLGLGAV